MVNSKSRFFVPDFGLNRKTSFQDSSENGNVFRVKSNNSIAGSSKGSGDISNFNAVDESKPLKTKYLTQPEIIGQGMQVIWTDLSQYYPEREDDPQLQLLKKKYARKSRCKNTLVIEPIGTFFELIDPQKDTFRLDEPCLK
jgi:hypothetical protein